VSQFLAANLTRIKCLLSVATCRKQQQQQLPAAYKVNIEFDGVVAQVIEYFLGS